VNVATSEIDIYHQLAQEAKENSGDEETLIESSAEPKHPKVKPRRRRILRVPFNSQVVVFGLILIGPVLVFYKFMFVTIFLSLPISKSLEAVPASLFSIYGTGIIIVALLAYSIVLNPSPFSLPKATEKISMELRLPRRYVNWHKFTDEEKFAILVTYLLRHREDLAPSPEPEHSSGQNDVRLLEEQERSEEDPETADHGRGEESVCRKTNDEDTQQASAESSV
jgi:hypothetical protein